MRRTVLRPRKLETGTHRVPVSNARRSKKGLNQTAGKKYNGSA